MKLLDPFAGYRLASGHPFFHIALFCGSFMIGPFGDSNNNFESTSEIHQAFGLLRWAHCILFMLATLQGFLDYPSDIEKAEQKTEGEELNEDEKEKAKWEVEHRDGYKKLFSRLCATVSVFLYQGSVFFAQMVLADNLIDCTSDSKCYITEIRGNRTLWLLIETNCFYLYMIATAVYIGWRMLREACAPANVISDMNKALKDFIDYASINLTWFAFNFVICLLPLICIGLQDEQPSLILEGKTGSFAPLVYTLIGMHVIHFASKLRIYEEREEKVSDHDRDDQFQAAGEDKQEDGDKKLG